MPFFSPYYNYILYNILWKQPIPTIRQIVRTGTVGDLPLLPYTTMVASCFVWFIYGILTRETLIWGTNIIELVLSVYYFVEFTNYAPRKSPTFPGSVLTHIRGVLGICAISIFIALFFFDSRIPIIGDITVLLTIATFASPFAALKAVLQSQSSQAIPWAFTLAAFTNCFFWSVVGILDMKDVYVSIPEVSGLVMTLIQILLKLYFGDRQNHNNDDAEYSAAAIHHGEHPPVEMPFPVLDKVRQLVLFHNNTTSSTAGNNNYHYSNLLLQDDLDEHDLQLSMGDTNGDYVQLVGSVGPSTTTTTTTGTRRTSPTSLRPMTAALALTFVGVCLLLQDVGVYLHQDNDHNHDHVFRVGQHRRLQQQEDWKILTVDKPTIAKANAEQILFDPHNYFQTQMNLNQQGRQRTHTGFNPHHNDDNEDAITTTTTTSSSTNLTTSRKGFATSRQLMTTSTNTNTNTNGTTTTSRNNPRPAPTKLKVPFADQQILFRKQNAWQLMVVVLVDDCIPHYDDGKPPTKGFPSLDTLRDVLQTQHADVVVYLPQVPQSTLFPEDTIIARRQQVVCQQKLTATIQTHFESAITQKQLQMVQGVVNPLPPRIKYDYNHGYPLDYAKLLEMKLNTEQLEKANTKLKDRLRKRQLQIELDYSLGLEFTYAAELAYQYADLLFFVRAGTRLRDEVSIKSHELDYGWMMIQHYEHFQQRLDRDLLVHRFCYQSFLQNDMRYQLPPTNASIPDDSPPQYQPDLQLPTGILMEKHGLYRMSLALRSLMPYHNRPTAGLLETYCKDLLWEAQILYPQSPTTPNITDEDISKYPPPLFEVPTKTKTSSSNNARASASAQWNINDQVYVDIDQAKRQGQQRLRGSGGPQEDDLLTSNTIPSWVTVSNAQLGPQIQNTPDTSHLLQMAPATQKQLATQRQRLVSFVVPTSTRPNGIKNQYVTYSLNQLIPLIKRDFYNPNTKQYDALILLVICGNTQEELDDHQKGLWEYYGPEIQQGIIEIVSTNLETYPTLYGLPNNYNDPENRLRWRSKQNLDISSSFFAAKGKSKYIMLLEDDTGYRDKFSSTLKMMLQTDMRREAAQKTAATHKDDYMPHFFAQIHFGFGYSGVLIHDDDALVYAVLHFIFMDEMPCDLMYLANHLQGQILDQKWRWQLKRVLLTHLGSVSSLKGKIQPVWGLKG